MNEAALLTVLLLYGADDRLYLADAFYSADECWATLTAGADDGTCISEAPPVEMLRPQARPDDFCRAPCVSLRPIARSE